MNELPALKTKVIEFQKSIVELKDELRQLQNAADKEAKRAFLEQLEWFDLLSLAIEDLKASEHTVFIKSFERLQKKMQRYFESHAILPVTPKHSEQDADCIKVLDTRPHPELPEGTVLEIIRPGYRWKGQVLRKAELVTVRNLSTSSGTAES